jgi:hypothetical protein
LRNGEMQPCSRCAVRGDGVGKSDKLRHYIRLLLNACGIAYQQADARRVRAAGVRRGRLRDHDIRIAGNGKVRDRAGLQPQAADGDGSGALGLTRKVGNADALSAQRFRHAHRPLAANPRARRGILSQNASGSNLARVEAVLNRQTQAGPTRGDGSVGGGQTRQRRHYRLAAMDREAHGDEHRNQRDGGHGERAEGEGEKSSQSFPACDSASRIPHG